MVAAGAWVKEGHTLGSTDEADGVGVRLGRGASVAQLPGPGTRQQRSDDWERG